MRMVILLLSELRLWGMVKLTKAVNLVIKAIQSSLLLIKEFLKGHMKHVLLRPMTKLCLGKVTLQCFHPICAGLMPRIHSGAVFSVHAFPLKNAVV